MLRGGRRWSKILREVAGTLPGLMSRPGIRQGLIYRLTRVVKRLRRGTAAVALGRGVKLMDGRRRSGRMIGIATGAMASPSGGGGGCRLASVATSGGL